MMDMVLNLLGLMFGIALVLTGADKFTDGACGIARKWKVSELVIGLTIVALGTSLPEFMVSFFSVLRGSSDMSVGNIIGSNIFNTLVIIGASAMMLNISVDKSLLMRDIPLSLLLSVILLGVTFFDGNISRMDGILLTALFICYIAYTFRIAMQDKKNNVQGVIEEDNIPMWKLVCFILLGGAGLVFGGNMLVNNAASLARAWGISESVIGLTILAGGTSLPELATSMMAAKKGSDGLALGNAIGSNVFNIAFVLGICSTIMPMAVSDIKIADWVTLIGSNVVLWIVAFTGKKLNKLEGLVLLLCYVMYLIVMLR